VQRSVVASQPALEVGGSCEVEPKRDRQDQASYGTRSVHPDQATPIDKPARLLNPIQTWRLRDQSKALAVLLYEVAGSECFVKSDISVTDERAPQCDEVIITREAGSRGRRGRLLSTTHFVNRFVHATATWRITTINFSSHAFLRDPSLIWCG
jgi:hypothetical protein